MADEADPAYPVSLSLSSSQTRAHLPRRMLARNHEVLRELLFEAKKHYLNASENMISIYVSTS